MHQHYVNQAISVPRTHCYAIKVQFQSQAWLVSQQLNQKLQCVKSQTRRASKKGLSAACSKILRKEWEYSHRPGHQAPFLPRKEWAVFSLVIQLAKLQLASQPHITQGIRRMSTSQYSDQLLPSSQCIDIPVLSGRYPTRFFMHVQTVCTSLFFEGLHRLEASFPPVNFHGYPLLELVSILLACAILDSQVIGQ